MNNKHLPNFNGLTQQKLSSHSCIQMTLKKSVYHMVPQC